MKFQAERVGNVYMLRHLKVTVGVLQLSSASRSEVVEQSETTMVSSSDVHFYPQKKIRTRRRRQIQIVTPMVEQILINPAWIKEIIG